MAFTAEVSKPPTEVGDICIIITDIAHETDADKDSIEYEVQLLQADGALYRVAKGNLAPHLTTQQIATVQSFVASMRELAQGMLPS